MNKTKYQKKYYQTILHIGLHKTGTTTLQKKVFPEFCKHKKYLYNPNAFYQIRKEIINLKKTNLKKKKKFKSFLKKNRVFISSENLAGWHSKNWEEFSKKILEYFGKNCHIIITVRDSLDRLNSLYTHMFLENTILDPSEFFNNENKKKYLKQKKQVRDRYPYETKYENYEQLKKIYEKKFNNVYFIPITRISNLYPWNIIFKLNVNDKKKFIKILNNLPKENVALCNFVIKFLLFFKHKKLYKDKVLFFKKKSQIYRKIIVTISKIFFLSKKFKLKKQQLGISENLVNKNKNFINSLLKNY